MTATVLILLLKNKMHERYMKSSTHTGVFLGKKYQSGLGKKPTKQKVTKWIIYETGKEKIPLSGIPQKLEKLFILKNPHQ